MSSTAPHMAPERVTELRLALRRKVFGESFADFVGYFFPLVTGRPFVANHATTAMCAVLQAVADGRLTRTLVAIPPGTGKTTLLSLYSAWRLARDPSHRSIHAMHSFDLAATESRRVRRVVESDEYRALFPHVRLRADENTVGHWATDRDGRYFALGTDSALTGRRAAEAVLDDPLNAVSRFSKAERDSLWAWFQESLSTRLDGDAAPITIVSQRLDPDDLIGRCAAAGGWTVVELAAEFDPDRRCDIPGVWTDPRTEAGELLAPNVLSREKLDALKQQIGSLAYACQFGQQPTPAGGHIVKMEYLRFWRPIGTPDSAGTRPRGCWTGPSVEIDLEKITSVVLAADLGMGRKTTAGDYNVVLAVGRWQRHFVLLEWWRARADFPEVARQYTAMAKRWPMARKTIERAAAGGSLETSLREAGVSGLVSIPPLGTKAMRMHAVLSFFEAGDVLFPEHAPGLADVVHELVMFNGLGTGGVHDDFPDALSLALGQAALSHASEVIHGGFCG